ncbi:MAG TPA: RNA 2',3'-cyclic phosphodiesterase [Methanocorpusculum sp.]|jgi:2'-5' RNA ligase|nr:RNA 2',3'-cyclic phosphodiesterase [Methanocorpusculum sp.]
MVRAFIAVEPSAEIRNEISAAGQELRGAGRLSFVSPNLMHITLKFLGEVPESQIPKITASLDGISASPYTLQASGISTFGRPPRVIKAEIHDSGATAALSADVESRMAKLGFAREEKPFSPHITIARVKEYSPALLPKINGIKERNFGECEISAILLKKSVLTPSGPIYSTIHRVNL